MDDKVLFEYKTWASPVVRVYQNRVEHYIGFTKKIIPISNISDIEQTRVMKTVKLNLNNGKTVTIGVPVKRSDEFISVLSGLMNNK